MTPETVGVIRELGSFGLIVVIVVYGLRSWSTQAERIGRVLDELNSALRTMNQPVTETVEQRTQAILHAIESSRAHMVSAMERVEDNTLAAIREHELLRRNHRERQDTPRST